MIFSSTAHHRRDSNAKTLLRYFLFSSRNTYMRKNFFMELCWAGLVRQNHPEKPVGIQFEGLEDMMLHCAAAKVKPGSIFFSG